MLATQTEVSDGTLNIVNVGIEFFEQDDILVSLDFADPLVLGGDYVWSTSTSIQFLDTASTPGGLVPLGVTVAIARHTDSDEMLNIFDGGAPFSRGALDEDFKQLLFLAQEFTEGTGFIPSVQSHNLRTPENIPELPIAASRAGKLLSFDGLGNPILVAATVSDATDLELRLGDNLAVNKGASMIGRGGQVVSSIAQLKALLKTSPSKYAFVTGYYLANDGGGGAYYLDVADLVSADNGGSIIVADDGGRWKLVWSGILSVKQFGAKGDYSFDTFSGADDTVALQKCADALAASGGEMYHPPGSYQVTSTVFVEHMGTNDFVRVSVTGAGSGASQIVSLGNISTYRFIGGAGAGVHSYQHIRGLHFRAVGGTFIGTAISVDNFSYGEFDDVLCENFAYGWNCTDILSSVFNRCQARGNDFGMNMSLTDASRPNAVTLTSCVFTANKTWGIVLGAPSAFTVIGGSIEGNGTDTGVPDRGGILMLGAGAEGAVGIAATGVYFEGNGGRADFFCASGGADGQVAHSFTGCMFNRLSASNFVTNCIRIDGQAKASLSVTGCGFKGYAPYVPNSGNQYIHLGFPDPNLIDFFEAGNFYHSDLERPRVVGQQGGPRASAAAYVRFDGSVGGATILQSYNVASVVRNGPGVYTVTYQRLMKNTANIYCFEAIGTGWRYRSAENTISVQVTTTDSVGTPVDLLGCCVTVFGELI